MAKQQLDLQAVTKHHFWILVAVVILALPTCWVIMRSSLDETFNQDRTARDSVRGSAENFAAGQQPNPAIRAVLDKRHEKLKDEVYGAWLRRYKDQEPWVSWTHRLWQNDANDFNVGQLQPLVIKAAQDYLKDKTKPMSKGTLTGYRFWLMGDEDPETRRKLSKFRRVSRLVGLREQVEIERPKVPEAGGNGAGEGEEVEEGGLPQDGNGQAARGELEWRGMVVWPQPERDFLAQKYGESPGWNQVTTDEVVFTHESLNVYIVLLWHVIQKTNLDPATNQHIAEHHHLAIKKLVTVRIGEDCQRPTRAGAEDAGAEAAGAAAPPAGGAPGGGDPLGDPAAGPGGGQGAQRSSVDADTPFALGTLGGGGGGNAPGGDGGGEGPVNEGPGGPPGVGGNDQAAGPRAPDGKNRYVDDDGFAVADPKATPPYSEFDMLPVHIRVVMDHRKLPLLLANCMNAPLPIEIKGWNMRTLQLEGGRQQGLEAAPGGGEALPPGGAPEDGEDVVGGNVKKVGGKRVEFGSEIEVGPYDREVEIRGVIKLYNPPDRQKVGLGTLATPEEPKPEAEAKEPEAKEKEQPMPMADGAAKSAP